MISEDVEKTCNIAFPTTINYYVVVFAGLHVVCSTICFSMSQCRVSNLAPTNHLQPHEATRISIASDDFDIVFEWVAPALTDCI
jgi:hypothetical protein